MLLRVYTDGACSKNPGPGGCSAIALEVYKNKEPEIVFTKTYSKKYTTNNAMELMGVLIALKKIDTLDISTDQLKIEICSDSSYVVNAINNKWINFWIKNNWNTKGGTPVKNSELWEKIYELITKYSVTFIKVKGHSDDKFNNMADKLAVEASRKAANK
jgi:ribonuclease HI